MSIHVLPSRTFLHAALSFLALSTLAVPALQAQITLGAQLNVAPSSATAGGTVSVSGDRLLVGGDYRVILVVSAGDRRTLTTVTDGDGTFQRSVVVPSIANGTYTLELTVDNVLRDSFSLRVLAPLAITVTPTSPHAGSSVNFSVSGLTEGSLSLLYDGRTAFGPVNVDNGTYNGRLRIPTDRPASLPANVQLDAKNSIGHIAPRVGTRGVSVQAANLSPFASVFNVTPSTPTPGLHQHISVAGSVATNEATPSDVSVDYFWTSGNGQVIPMGAATGEVLADGSFVHEMLAPQIGTMSAMQANGPGQLTTVTHFTDAHGTAQQFTAVQGSMFVGLDFDDAIDLTFVLNGSDNLRIEGARIELVEADLDALYYDNAGPVPLTGAQMVNGESQFAFSDNVQATFGCPANIQHQYSDSDGLAEFEFNLDIPVGGVNLDGSGPAPRMTIEPSVDCSPGADINTPGFCTTTDPAGLEFDVVVRAAHTGYGYVQPYQLADGSMGERELPVTIHTRIDRINGAIGMDVCAPGQPCVHHDYNRSANLSLTLPDLNRTGLLLGHPYFKGTQSGSGIEQAIEVESTSNALVTFKPIMDLTPFRGSASFAPATPPVRLAEFRYNAGAGRPLREARFFILRNGSWTSVPMARVAGGSASCEGEAGDEVWRAALPSAINEGFRFPRYIYGNTPAVYGYVEGIDLDDRRGVSLFELQFEPLDGAIAAYAGTPGIRIDTEWPHARRMEIVPAIPPSVAQSAAAPSAYHLPSKRSEVSGVTDYEFCIPKSASNCGALSTVDFDHKQFSSTPGSPPPGAYANEAGKISSSTGTSSNPWERLFNHTIPIFRWYWGIPELFSAEVFADLAIRAEYMMKTTFDPASPQNAKADAGGRLGVGVWIGVDIDVLFGILVDAGAAIYGGLTAEVVTETNLSSATVSPCLLFSLDFSGWLEIGCPIPNPLDPTCYIPNIEDSFNILQSRNPSGCGFRDYRPAGFDPQNIFAGLQRLSWPSASASTASPTPNGTAPPVNPFPRELQRAMYRSPALAFDGTGNRMVLNLDSNGRLVAHEGSLHNFGAAQIISSGFGIRDVAVSYFSADRAIAVWAETRLPQGQPFPPLTRDTAASNQRLRYALFDGHGWGAPVNLTAGGFGEGQVRLARCVSLSLPGGCVQKVSLVFQRNTQGTVGGQKHIFFAQFDGTNWTTPVQVDQSGTINITPSLTYAGGDPVIAWVRYAPTSSGPPVSLTDVSRRFLAVRIMDGHHNEEISVAPGDSGVAQPSIAGKITGQIALAFTVGDSDSFIGTRQSLHMGERSCASGQSCPFTTWQVDDQHGREIFVERPTINFNGDGDAVVTFRGLAYGPVPGMVDPTDNLFDDDPVGIRTTRGELMQIRSPLQAAPVWPIALSSDGATHYQPVAAYDAVNGEVVSISVTISTPEFNRQAQSLTRAGVRPMAQTMALDDGIELATMADLPELFIDGLTTTATRLTPGASIPVTVRIANRGSAWTVDARHTAQVRLWWDTPQTRTVTSASFSLPSIGAGAGSTRTLQVNVPTAFGVDEKQVLRAAIEVDSEDGEIDGDNNEATLAVGGMPVPATLMAVSAPGTRFVNLLWTAPTDNRIAGYRVYVDDPDGVPRPFGSSFNKGWADLTALYGRTRNYRVSSYSARGIESELSAPVRAEPAPALVTSVLFGDGFE